MCNAERITNDEIMDKVVGGIDEQPVTETHATCPLCGMEVWFTKDVTVASHQESRICKMGRKEKV